MRFLADFIMRGRVQASLVIAGSAAIPLLFWLSAAASSLVLMRRGLTDGLSVIGWALIPALVWWYLGDLRVLPVLLGTTALGLILRQRPSWQPTLLASVALGGLFGVLLTAGFGETLQALGQEVTAQLPSILPQGAWDKLSADERTHFIQLLGLVIVGLLSALLQLLSIVSLMLGRYWQAMLYNPGGFAQEFQALRLSPLAAGLLLAGTLAWLLDYHLVVLAPICSVPLIFASLALVHGLVALGRVARFWLVGLYVVLVLLLQVVYPLLAVVAFVDSLFDFRGRAVRNSGQGPANGEG